MCPQFTAIDAQLTVREHLHVYARLKGLRRGAETARNVHAIMAATGLDVYADRLASKLSGGNQRKLAPANAPIDTPPVLLVDEFLSSVDAKMKRDTCVPPLPPVLLPMATTQALPLRCALQPAASLLGSLSARPADALFPTACAPPRFAGYLVCHGRSAPLR